MLITGRKLEEQGHYGEEKDKAINSIQNIVLVLVALI